MPLLVLNANESRYAAHGACLARIHRMDRIVLTKSELRAHAIDRFDLPSDEHGRERAIDAYVQGYELTQERFAS